MAQLSFRTDRHIVCLSCTVPENTEKLNWCDHIQNAMMSHEDADFIWTDRPPSELWIPMFPVTGNLWQKVRLEEVSKQMTGLPSLYVRRMIPNDVTGTNFKPAEHYSGMISQGEGRYVIRSLLVEEMRSKNVKLTCPSPAHGYTEEMTFQKRVVNSSWRIAESWSVYVNKCCISCHNKVVFMDTTDLIPGSQKSF